MSEGRVFMAHVAEIHTKKKTFCCYDDCPKKYSNYDKYLVYSHEKRCKGSRLSSTLHDKVIYYILFYSRIVCQNVKHYLLLG
jgi:hypothetical protein